MSATPFDAVFESLRLPERLPGNSVEATFSAEPFGQTIISSPGEEPASDDLRGETMPILRLGSNARSEPDAGELIAVKVLGEGGMGRVLLARQQSLGRVVAVKTLKHGARNPAAAQALVDEARTSGSLEHPGVLPVYALAHDDTGHPAVVMKRVDGVSWSELLHRPDHPMWQHIAKNDDRLEAHLEILVSVCNAIAHAHQRGVIHRDLKPANVLIGELGETYLADWGVAIQKERPRSGERRLVGTPAYLAPEMVTGDAALTDERTDVYLLGATLHEVLTGKAPHLAPSLREALEKAFASLPPTMPEAIPAELVQLCATAMAADPRDRFQTAIEFRDALRLYLALRGSSRFVETAKVRLATLVTLFEAGTGDDAQRWYTLLSECRFSFAQALDAFPLNFAAQRGLEQCLQLAVRRELKLRNLGAARTFMTELAHLERPLELTLGLGVLEREELERQQRGARLDRLEHESNPSVSARQRNLLLAAFFPTIGVLTWVGYVAQKTGAIGSSWGWTLALPPLVILALYLIGVYIGRRSLLSTRLNRQLTLVVGVNLLFVFVARLFTVALGLPLHVGFVFEAVMLSALASVMIFMWHWGLVFPAGIFLVGAIGCASFPAQALYLFAAAAILGIASELVVLRVWRSEPSATHPAA